MIFEFPKAIIYNVVDGDTFDAIVDTGFKNTHKDRFRLVDINCPEKRGETREEGLRVTEIVKEKILDKEVALKTYYQDSFGRWICDVFIDGKNLSDWLFENGLGVR